LLPLTAVTLNKLRITDLILHPSSPQHLAIPGLNGIEFLYFDDVHNSRIMEEIIRLLTGLAHISLTRCTFVGMTDTFWPFNAPGFETMLELIEINHDMTPFLRNWNYTYLRIQGCPRFDDKILDLMGTKENEDFPYAPFVRRLVIRDSSSVSVAALRRFIESRLGLSANFHQVTITTRMQSIQLFGCVLSLSREDSAWFTANLSTFRCS
jgi:hypothetical protein